MQESTVSILTSWQNFYVIVGSASGALIGLMFVVITLKGESRSRTRQKIEPLDAFGTPTVMHFSSALFIATFLCAPWQILWVPSLLLGIFGLGGIIYIAIVTRRALLQTDYTLVLEDWLWHTIFPFISYITFILAGALLPNYSSSALFIIGAATILLLFIGIHNSWDTITYIALVKRSQPENNNQD